MTGPRMTPEQLDQIQARADRVAEWRKAFHAPQNSMDYSQRDVPALLALVREQAAAIERGLAACDRVIKNEDGHKPPGPPHPTREQATAARIRAALTATEGA